MKARESGQIPYPSPRQNLPPHQRKVPPLALKENGMDASPRKSEEDDLRPFAVDKPTHAQKRHYFDESPKNQQVVEPAYGDKENVRAHSDRKEDRNLNRFSGRSKDDSYPRDAKEKYQWYNERHLSPPVGVRRSRSLSPPLDLEKLHEEIEQKREELQVVLVELEHCCSAIFLYGILYS